MRFLRETLPALLLSFASVCRAQTLPTISPATQATVTIENPRSPHAKSYLDLDSAKTFQREDAPEEFVRSRRWITESGIDLMCETEPPAEGFVAYDLTIVEDPDVFDAITDYADTRKRLSGLEPKTFDFVSVLSQPKTLIFRTREDAIGALEVATASDPSALSVRVKVLAPPPRPEPPASNPELQQQQRRVEILRLKYGRNHPLMAQTERQLRHLQPQAATKPAVENNKTPATRPSATKP